MLANYAQFRRSRLLASAAAILPPLLIAGIVMVPKSPAYAGPMRLGWTVAVFAVAGVGLPLWAAAGRRAREARLAFQYHGASSAIRNTARFLADERRSATRGLLPAAVAAITLAGLYTISAWPQLAALNPGRPLFGVLAIAALILAGFALHGQRKRMINTLYLRTYLRQQTRHIGFRPRCGRDARRQAAELKKPAVTCATATGFRAAGFDWQLGDWTNAIVFGQPGSGKTATVLNTLLEAMVATSAVSGLRAAGLTLDVKGDYKSKLDLLARRYGRESDIVTFSASGWALHGGTMRAIRWNPLDSTDDGLEIAARLVTAGKLAGIQSTETFFQDSARTFLRHGIEFIRAGSDGEPPSLLDLRRLATEFADDGGYYFTLSKAVVARYADTAAIPHAVNDAIQFLESEWRTMADRQRSAVIGTLTQLIDEFSVEPFRAMMSGRSTVTIGEIIDSGKVLYIDLPTAERPRMSILAASLIKLEFQREICRRVDKQRPSFLLCDEFPVLWTTGDQGDADFFALSRQSRHANIVAAQNISAFYKKTGNKDEARNFLGNCSTKVFLRNTETETNLWASQLFGERSEIIVSANESASLNDGLKRAVTSYGRSTASMPAVPPEAFSTLAVPVRGDRTAQYSEAIVHLATRATTLRLDLAWRLNPLEA